MQIPQFPETHHPLIQSLSRYSDRDLLVLFQRHPEQGRYFTTLFCRYYPIVYTLILHSLRSPVQVDYLFAQIWRHVYYELGGLDLRNLSATGFNLQNWLINITAHCINNAQLPEVESIHYNLTTSPPVLWCYLNQALDRLPPLLRLIIIMAQTFRWSETRIAAYLRAEGEKITPKEVAPLLQEAFDCLEEEIPADIQMLYWEDTQDSPAQSEGVPHWAPTLAQVS